MRGPPPAPVSREASRPPGDSVLGFITFEVPAGSRIAKVQFAMSSGFAGKAGQWDVTAR
jgi:hypothetical protein